MIESTMNYLKEIIQKDSDYAYGWHCNLAMMAYDAGATHKRANIQAGNFMERVFGLNTYEIYKSYHKEDLTER